MQSNPLTVWLFCCARGVAGGGESTRFRVRGGQVLAVSSTKTFVNSERTIRNLHIPTLRVLNRPGAGCCRLRDVYFAGGGGFF